MGWATVVAYFAVSWACWRAAATEGRRAHGDRSVSVPFWLLLTGFLLLLGINKQLDLQSDLTDFGHRLAREQGWYDRRQEIQSLFIALIAAVGLVVVSAFDWLARAALRGHLSALLGPVFLVNLILIRSLLFHHVDVLIGLRLGA